MNFLLFVVQLSSGSLKLVLNTYALLIPFLMGTSWACLHEWQRVPYNKLTILCTFIQENSKSKPNKIKPIVYLDFLFTWDKHVEDHLVAVLSRWVCLFYFLSESPEMFTEVFILPSFCAHQEKHGVIYTFRLHRQVHDKVAVLLTNITKVSLSPRYHLECYGSFKANRRQLESLRELTWGHLKSRETGSS